MASAVMAAVSGRGTREARGWRGTAPLSFEWGSESGREGKAGSRAGGEANGSAWHGGERRRREVRGDPDGWVPPGSERERVEVGWTGPALLG